MKGPRVQVEAAGPVFARVKVNYEYEGGGRYEFVIELRAGEEAAQIRESSVQLNDAAFVFDFAKIFDRGFWNAHSPSLKKLGKEAGATSYQNFAIDYREPSISTIVPLFAWSLDHSTWFSMHSGDRSIRDWIGFFAMQADEWRGGRGAALLVETGPEGLRVRARLSGAERRWGIVAAKSEDAVIEKTGEPNKCFRAQVRLGQTPLDRVRKMTLAWDRPADSYDPHLLIKKQDLDGINRRVAEDAAFRRLFEAGKQRPGAEQDGVGAFLATGDLAYAKTVKNQVLSALKRWIQEFLTNGYGFHNNVAIALTRNLRRTAVDWDFVANSAAATDSERKWADAAFAFLSNEISDPNYWPSRERGFEQGPVNFHSDHYSCLAALACLLVNHPRHSEWLAWTEEKLNDEMVRWSYPSGAWEEAPNYQCATVLFLLPMIRMLRLNGFGFARSSEFKATMRFLGDIQTPYDPRRKTAMLPPVGDTTFAFHSQSLQNVFAWAARSYADDAEFAGRMMWHWKQGGSLLCGAHDGSMVMGRWTGALVMVDPSIPVAEPAGHIRSMRLDGYGAKLHQRNAAGEETYVLIKCGAARSHYHPDELSIHYYGKGMPLALDYGSMYEPRVNQPWFHNRIAIDHKRDEAHGEIADFVALDAADYFAGELTVNSITEAPELPDAPYSRAYEKPWVKIPPVSWMRQIMLSRADCLVICDTISGDLPTDWSLHVLAKEVEARPGGWRFHGQLGVDLDLHADGEKNLKTQTGEWGYSGANIIKGIANWRLCSLDLPLEAVGETQKFVRQFRGPGQGYRVLLAPRKPDDQAPTVKVLSCGFSISSDNWREWMLVGGSPTILDDGLLSFRGRAGFARESKGETSLALHSGDRLRLGAVGIESAGPVSLVVGASRVAGATEGRARQVIVTWAKVSDARPRLRLDGQPHPAAHTLMLDRGQYLHHLVFDVAEGAHRFEIA